MAEQRFPQCRRDGSVIGDHFGTNVPDPYRWLEDPDSTETQEFVKAQNAITEPFLTSCSARAKVHARYMVHTND